MNKLEVVSKARVAYDPREYGQAMVIATPLQEGSNAQETHRQVISSLGDRYDDYFVLDDGWAIREVPA